MFFFKPRLKEPSVNSQIAHIIHKEFLALQEESLQSFFDQMRLERSGNIGMAMDMAAAHRKRVEYRQSAISLKLRFLDRKIGWFSNLLCFGMSRKEQAGYVKALSSLSLLLDQQLDFAKQRETKYSRLLQA